MNRNASSFHPYHEFHSFNSLLVQIIQITNVFSREFSNKYGCILIDLPRLVCPVSIDRFNYNVLAQIYKYLVLSVLVLRFSKKFSP